MDSTSGSFRRAWEILGATLDLPPEDRHAFVSRSCSGDETLQRLVEELLSRAAESSGILDRPLSPSAAGILQDLAEGEAAVSGIESVGSYRLVRELGRGGMGIIFLAERAEGGFQQKVALKLIKKGLDSEEIVARFLRERQILARLQHPHIARLLDGGMADDGRPFFAMEFVEGEPLLVYSDRRRLGIEPRLRLFLDACSAVQYAHRSLVVHRDLKPSNILVTSDGQLKLLDFGIAGLLEGEGSQERTALTREGPSPMTPEYAAPEQLRGEPATTATDVYSLGVVLYELLAGRHPYRSSGDSALELQKAVLDTNPLPPSQAAGGSPQGTDAHPAAARGLTPERLRRRLSGDLDVIVLAALKKEPERRYPSPEALAQDLERHLGGLPVQARKDTLGYRSRKFIARHRVGVVTAALILLSIVAGMLGTLWQAREARREAARAETVKDFLVSIFKVNDPSESRGEQVTARELLDRGAERIERELASQPKLHSEMLRVIGELYKVLGLLEPSEKQLRRALELNRAAAPGGGAELAATLDLLASTLLEKGSYEEASKVSLEAVALSRRVHGEKSMPVARCLSTLGAIEGSRGNLKESERYHREALTVSQALMKGDNADVAVDLQNLGSTLYQEERLDEAEPFLRQALEMYRKLGMGEGPTAAQALNDLGLLLAQRPEYEEGKRLLEESIRIKKKVYGPAHSEVAFSLSNLATVLTDMGQLEESASLLREVMEMHRKALGDSHPEIARDHNNLAVALYRLGKYQEASEEFRRAIEIWKPELGAAHPSVAAATNNMGMCEREKGNLARAEALVREGMEGRIKNSGTESQEVCQSERNLGLILTDQGRLPEARKILAQSLDLARKVYPAEHPRLAEVLVSNARLQVLQRSGAEAQPMLAEAMSILEGQFGKEDPRYAEAEMLFAGSRTLQGEFAESQSFLENALRVREAAFGKDSAPAAEARSYLAVCLAGLGRRDPARQAAASALSTLTGKLGPAHWMVLQARSRLSSLLPTLRVASTSRR